jgi:hypothetical protein
MPEQQDLFALEIARALRDDGIERAQHHAGFPWQLQADKVLRMYLAQPFPRTFTAEDVRDWGCRHGLISEPPDRRAWGGVLTRAAHTGQIRKVGVREHRDPVRHCGLSNLWERTT